MPGSDFSVASARVRALFNPATNASRPWKCSA
jgi:hypothetical protein